MKTGEARRFHGFPRQKSFSERAFWLRCAASVMGILTTSRRGLRSALLLLIGVTSAFAGQYSQNFNSFAVGATNFGDGSQLFSSESGLAQVEDPALKELQLSRWDSVNQTRAAFLLPDLDAGLVVTNFTASWVSPVYGNFPSASIGFSFSFGSLRSNDLASATYTQERGFGTGLSLWVQTLATSTTPGWYLRNDGTILATVTNDPVATWGNFSATRHAFQVSWDQTAGLSVSQDGVVIFTNVPTPGFVPKAGDGFVWATRCGAGIAETFRIDNISVTTHTVGPPIMLQPAAVHDVLSRAQVTAQIDARGLPTTVITELGTNLSYGITLTNTLAATNGVVLFTNAPIFAVDRATTLHARLTVSNAMGSVNSGDLVFQASNFERRVGYGTATNYAQAGNGGIWADVNDDGLLDLAYSGEGPGPGADLRGGVLINSGQAGVAWPSIGVMPETCSFIAAGDFDNDNRPDTYWTGAREWIFFFSVGRAGTKATILYGVAKTNGFFGTARQALQFPYYLAFNRSIVADFDHDGRQDIVFNGAMDPEYGGSGLTNDPQVVYGKVSRLLRNEYLGSRRQVNDALYESYFRLMPVGIPPGQVNGPGLAAWISWYMSPGDLDGDGFPDIYGYGFNDPATPNDGLNNLGWALFHSDGEGGFSKIGMGPRNLGNTKGGGAGSVWADFNGDGHLDLFVAEGAWENFPSGDNGGPLPRTEIFLNDGQGNLTNSGWQLPPMGMASVAAGDIFNHGRNDILINGCFAPYQSDTYILRNDGGGVFTQVRLGIGIGDPVVSPNGQGVRLADFDNDGRLDCSVVGGSGKEDWFANEKSPSIYRNEMAIPTNQPPQAPTNLFSTVGPGTVTFHWGNASDDITPANLLTYNLRVGTNSLGTSVVSPLANETNGWRKIAEPGNCWHTFSTTYHFPPGTYYWSIQAIDGAYAGGAWAPEQTFTITEPERPRLSLAKGNAESTVHWPARFPDYTLQMATSLSAPNWSTVTNSPYYDNGKIKVSLTNASGARFFRLGKP